MGKHWPRSQAPPVFNNNEALSNSLTALALSGIVSENPSWSLKTTSLQKRNVRYRVEDPYTRFYIKDIRPQLVEINKGLYRNITLRQLPGWEATAPVCSSRPWSAKAWFPRFSTDCNCGGFQCSGLGLTSRVKTARHPAVQIDDPLENGRHAIRLRDEVHEKRSRRRSSMRSRKKSSASECPGI